MKRRVALWAEMGATILTTHWLLIVGSFLVYGSLMLKWIKFPYSRDVIGLQLPVLRDVGLIPHAYLLSYGVLGFAVLGTGVVFSRFSRLRLAPAAAILIALWVLVPCQIAFQQPALLGRLTAEAQVLPLIRDFTRYYLPPNYGDEEEIPKSFDLYTVRGRFDVACSFLGVGWYCFGAGSLLIAIHSIGRFRQRRGVMTLRLSSIPVGVVAILLTPPLIGQHFFTRASTAKAQGQDQKAISYYRKTISWDRWRAQDVEIYATIGELEKQCGIVEDSRERHISKAQEFNQARQYELAIFECNRAAEGGSALAAVARRESAWSRVNLGLALHRTGGIGIAVSQWEQALAEDPLRLRGLAFLIARGEYDLAQYQAALDAIHRVLSTTGDKPVLANAYTLGGDCYEKLGWDADARNYYNLALKTDSSLNYWAITGLVGE